MAQHTDQRYGEELGTLRKHILEMGGLVERQIGDASNSLATSDRALAERTIERDREVSRYDVEIDDLHAAMFREVLDKIRDDSSLVAPGLAQLFVSKYLERIADHATNIAEMVIFMVKGKSIRHIALPNSIEGMVR
jgi:phosphate transport system protein